MSNCLEYIKICPGLSESLTEFFGVIDRDRNSTHFHPHAFSQSDAIRISNYVGKDLYLVLVVGKKILGYGMLRGWDDGYDIPSLGIVIHPEARKMGLADPFTRYLHMNAKWMGAKDVRLKVHIDNFSALKLYKNLGYKFGEPVGNELVGHLNL